MRIIYNKVFLEHHTGMHPESRKRLELFNDLLEVGLESGIEYLRLIHSRDYIRQVQDASRLSAHLDQDTITSPGSFEAACYAVGATVLAAEEGGFALVRPPGHHAYPHKASGFCLFNSVAIAAEKLAREGRRVLIFDFDGHLGDGTSDIFYDNDRVMYWSLHQYPAFPGHGFVDEIGIGKGKGFTVNVPLPPGCGDDIFMDAIKNFLPVAEQFQPDIVAVSAGFDAHLYDPLLDMKTTVGSYYQIGSLLRERFPKIFATLEGGYNIDVLRRCVYNFVAGINGALAPFTEEPTVSGMRVWETYDMYLHTGIGLLSKYWKF